MDRPHASQHSTALPRRQVERVQLEESQVVSAPLPEAFPAGLVERPSTQLLRRVRDELQALDQPAPATRQEVWGS